MPLREVSTSPGLRDLVISRVLRGKSVATIAKETGLSQKDIREALDSPEGQSLLASVVTEAGSWRETLLEVQKERTASLVPSALDRLEEIVETPFTDWPNQKTPTMFRAVDSVLDRGGLSRKVQTETKVTITLDPETVRLLTRAAREAGALSLPRSDWSYAYGHQGPEVPQGPQIPPALPAPDAPESD